MEQSRKDKSYYIILRGVLIAVISSLLGVLIFAAIVKTASLSSSVIKAVNQFIKIIAVFLGCFFSVKGSKGFIKGMVIGAISLFITYTLFTIIGGAKFFSLSLLFDLLLGLIAGALCGIITVNVRKN